MKVKLNKIFIIKSIIILVFCTLQTILTFANTPNEKPTCLTITILQDQFKYSCPQRNNGKINIKIKGGVAPYYIFWKDERGRIGGPISTEDSLAEIRNLAPLAYTFEVFDNGIGAERCFSGLQGPIDMLEARLEVATDLVAMPLCHGGENGQLSARIQLNGAAVDKVEQYQFIWQNEGQDTVGQQFIVENLPQGDYTLTARTNNGCTATSAINLPEPAPLKIEEWDIQPAYCADSDNGQIELSQIAGGTGEHTVTWEAFSGYTSPIISNLKPATYHFTIQDENGCVLSDSATVDTMMHLTLNLVEDQSQLMTSCHDSKDAKISVVIKDNLLDEIEEKITQPFQFDWSENVNALAIDFNASRIHSLGADTFQVWATNPDLPGCWTTLAIQTTSPPPLQLDTANTLQQAPDCINPFSGTSSFTVYGGTPNYQFYWSDGRTGKERVDLPVGNYTVTISDQNGCKLLQDIVIPKPDSLYLSLETIKQESCLGTADGEIRVSTNKNAAELAYFWQPNVAHDSIAKGLGNGLYTIEVEDENGCSDVLEVEIESLINQVNQPVLQADNYEFDFYASKPMNVLANDDLLDQAIQLTISENPKSAPISIDGQNTLQLANTNYFYDNLDFTYEVCLATCPVICSSAQVKVVLKGAEFFPSGFTPNGDGINDELVFPQLTGDFADNWPNNELIVFNRWGSIVYQTKPYLNDWDGTNYKNGKPLPAGTYFYVLRLDIGEGKIKQRELTILR